jgi:hypothetical protein
MKSNSHHYHCDIDLSPHLFKNSKAFENLQKNGKNRQKILNKPPKNPQKPTKTLC